VRDRRSPGSTPPAPVARCPRPPHRTSAADAGLGLGGHTGGSGPRRYQSGAPPCAVRSLPGIAVRCDRPLRRLRNAGSASAARRRSVHRGAEEWGGRLVDRRRDRLSGLGAWGSLSVSRENAVRLVAFLLQALTFPLPSLVLLLQPFDLPLGSVELWLGDQLDDFALLPLVRRTAATGCFHLLYGSGKVGFCPAKPSRG